MNLWFFSSLLKCFPSDRNSKVLSCWETKSVSLRLQVVREFVGVYVNGLCLQPGCGSVRPWGWWLWALLKVESNQAVEPHLGCTHIFFVIWKVFPMLFTAEAVLWMWRLSSSSDAGWGRLTCEGRDGVGWWGQRGSGQQAMHQWGSALAAPALGGERGAHLLNWEFSREHFSSLI